MSAVLVVGDVMLDRRVIGECSRIAAEGPVPVLSTITTSESLGGAGNVAQNIVAMGLPAYLLGSVADDSDGNRLRQLAAQRGITSCLVPTADRTTVKTRTYTTDGHLLSRADVDATKTDGYALLAGVQNLAASADSIRLIVVADYNKGAVTPELVECIKSFSRAKNIPVYVDCRPENVHLFHGAALLKPNMAEALVMLADDVHPGLHQSIPTLDKAYVAASLLQRKTGVGEVVLTLGALGCVYYDPADNNTHAFQLTAKHVYDVCGAGDTTMAALAVARVEGMTASIAVRFAMTAASIAVGEPGTYAVSRDEIQDRLYTDTGWAAKPMAATQLCSFLERKRRDPLNCIVLANGCFDGLHAGHIELLRFAKQQGTVLVVANNDDASLRLLKGTARPLVPVSYRVSHLALQDVVDAVFTFDGDVEKLVRMVKPDIMVKGEDSVRAPIPGSDYVASYGGEVRLAPITFRFSSSGLLGGQGK